MKKIFSILMLLIIVISYGENNKLEKLNLYKFNKKGVVGEAAGGVDFILNQKNNRTIVMYFKKNGFDWNNTVIHPFYNEIELENKNFLISDFFNKNNLDSYYSRNYIELKSREKFLYGKIILEVIMEYLKLELYFIDKNNEEKKKVFFKKFDGNILHSILKKINENSIEGYYYTPYGKEELTLFTSEKIIHKKIKFNNFNGEEETFLTEDEKSLYNYLTGLFREEIPKEFFEGKTL